MNKLYLSLIGLVSMVAISCANPDSNVQENNVPQEQTQAEIKNVSVAALKSAIGVDGSITVLDVRTAGEVKEGYVPNASNVDVNGNDFESGVKDLDKSKTVYVYCRSGHRSMTASKKLIAMGFTDVRNVKGGFMAWEQAGFPIAK